MYWIKRFTSTDNLVGQLADLFLPILLPLMAVAGILAYLGVSDNLWTALKVIGIVYGIIILIGVIDIYRIYRYGPTKREMRGTWYQPLRSYQRPVLMTQQAVKEDADSRYAKRRLEALYFPIMTGAGISLGLIALINF